MSVDWHDLEHDWEVKAYLVDQHASGLVIGELAGLDASRCEVVEGYYSDTRVSAKLETVVGEGESDGYVPNARIRLVLGVPRWGWERELVTGFVTDVVPRDEDGCTRREYSLDSTLWGLSADYLTSKLTCSAGAKALTAAKKILSDRGIEYDADGARDRSIQKVTVYEPGTVALSTLFDILSGYSRLDVNGRGIVTIRAYTPPSKLTPSVTIDPYDPRTNVVGDVRETDTSWEKPGAAIVTANVSKSTTKNGKSVTTHEVRAGTYFAPASDPASRDARGYLRFAKDTYSGSADEPTTSELTNSARTVWNNNQDKGRSWELLVIYMDLHEGDVVSLVRPDGTHRCLVQSVTTSLDPTDRTQKLTLKEV